MDGEWVSAWICFFPANVQPLHQSPGPGRGELGDRGVEEGTDLTWNTTRRTTTSTLFIGFPAGDKVKSYCLAGTALRGKESRGDRDADGAFITNSRHSICQNRTSQPDCASEHLASCPESCPYHLFPLHFEVPERSRPKCRAVSPFLALQGRFWSWRARPGPDQPSRLSFS